MRTFYLSEISDSLQIKMGEWKQQAAREIAFDLISGDEFYDIFEKSEKPGYLVLANIIYALERVYKDIPMELYFKRDSTGIRFDFWGYNPDSLVYRPGGPIGYELSTAYDLMYIQRSDTTIISDTTLYDLIFIYKTMVDTMYMPTGSKPVLGRGPLKADDNTGGEDE